MHESPIRGGIIDRHTLTVTYRLVLSTMSEDGQTLSGPELGELAKERIAQLGHSQQWLAEEVARLTGEILVGQPSVSKWLRDLSSAPPYRLFAIEHLLELPPGAYSRHLGYVPVGAVNVFSVVEAIAADPELDPLEAAALRAHYETVVTLKRARRRQSLETRPDADEGVQSGDDPPVEVGSSSGRRGRQRR